MSGVAGYTRRTMTATLESAATIQDLVRDAVESRTPLRIAGRSHWIDAGRPVDATRIASLASHSGVVDYVPGDLTITVRSGTTLSEIERVTGAEGQWLPLDPHGSGDGTIGATIATGSFGPLAHAFGRARDLVLGLEFVSGDGRVIRGGGRVVKNVAGFDLTRLLTGSWGTLGIITEATLRLYSRPRTSLTVAMSVPDGSQKLAERLAAILDAPVTPYTVELVSAAAALRLGLPARPTALVELGGNAASVVAQRGSLSRLGGMVELPASLRSSIRSLDADRNGHQPIVLRLSSLPARLAEIWTTATERLTIVEGVYLHATPSVGIVRCIVPASADSELVTSLVSNLPGVTVVYERLTPDLWNVLSPSVVSDRLSAGMRDVFDPHRILNPGILGGLAS